MPKKSYFSNGAWERDYTVVHCGLACDLFFIALLPSAIQKMSFSWKWLPVVVVGSGCNTWKWPLFSHSNERAVTFFTTAAQSAALLEKSINLFIAIVQGQGYIWVYFSTTFNNNTSYSHKLDKNDF